MPLRRTRPGRNDESPTDLMFWYELALKMAMTATIVVIASVAVERSGPFIGALIASLPTAAGAAYIILAIEHPPAFIAASAVGSLAAGAAVSVFALAYAVLAQRHGIVVSITAGDAGVVCRRGALRLVDWTPFDRDRAQYHRIRRHDPGLRAPIATPAVPREGPSNARATTFRCAPRPRRWSSSS